ncbi:MAG: hypothetical protein HOV94_12390 [Saccharothrix sp.]|nr:hypothetical protein [Saccharothrix sp.]
MSTVITEPGVYDLPDDVYHADPVPGGSLSASGAKLILDCPARFRHAADHGSERKDVFDFGTAAHKFVLGTGPEIEIIDARDWKTKAAQEAKKAAHAKGHVPLLPHELDDVQAMAKKVEEHPIAGALFERGTGNAEQSLFWHDDEFEVWRRARLDWLPLGVSSAGRLIVPDYKTTVSADPDTIPKTIYNFRYHLQADWYSEAVQALGLAERVLFLFVFQEKQAPYIVTVAEVEVDFLRLGRSDNRRALALYADCVATGNWPGYSDDVVRVEPPRWAVAQLNAQEHIW